MNKLSIVTICYNDKEGLSKTFDSLKYKPDGVEWFIVDGNSSDGTVDLIKSFGKVVSAYISEPDDGIADAFNKGIQMVSAGHILFLNAGDALRPEFLNNVSDVIDSDVVVYKIKFGERVTGKPVSCQRQMLRNYLPHQGMLINKNLFEQFGDYDSNFKLGMDYEWSLRLLPYWKQLVSFETDVIVDMDDQGVSVTNYIQTYRAYHRARLKNKTLFPVISALISCFYIIYVFCSKRIKGVISFVSSVRK